MKIDPGCVISYVISGTVIFQTTRSCFQYLCIRSLSVQEIRQENACSGRAKNISTYTPRLLRKILHPNKCMPKISNIFWHHHHHRKRLKQGANWSASVRTLRRLHKVRPVSHAAATVATLAMAVMFATVATVATREGAAPTAAGKEKRWPTTFKSGLRIIVDIQAGVGPPWEL